MGAPPDPVEVLSNELARGLHMLTKPNRALEERRARERGKDMADDETNDVQALLRDLLLELDTIGPGKATARYDRLAQLFYDETGIMAPGKDVAWPMAASQPPDDVRRDQWRKWAEARHQRLVERLRAAVEVAP